MTKISKNTVSLYELQAFQPGVEIALGLAENLDVTVEDLFTYSYRKEEDRAE